MTAPQSVTALDEAYTAILGAVFKRAEHMGSMRIEVRVDVAGFGRLELCCGRCGGRAFWSSTGVLPVDGGDGFSMLELDNIGNDHIAEHLIDEDRPRPEFIDIELPTWEKGAVTRPGELWQGGETEPPPEDEAEPEHCAACHDEQTEHAGTTEEEAHAEHGCPRCWADAGFPT